MREYRSCGALLRVIVEAASFNSLSYCTATRGAHLG